jgi:hypothetical protein
MPYISRQASIIGKTDAGGAGMKKAGLVASSDYPRVSRHHIMSRTVQKVPTFTLANCGTRARVYGTRIVHGRPVPL